MLVLSRKTQESIRIGDDIEVVVSAIQGNRVRIGIRAPASVPILREELAEDAPQRNVTRRPAGRAAPSPMYGEASTV